MSESTLQQMAVPQLSGNALKILAAVAMTIDHVGLVFFPSVSAFRHIGRLAFPIFAFMIAEGCVHSRRPLRYFLSVLVLALVCQTAYTVAMRQWLFCVPVSFSMAIPLVLALHRWKRALFSEGLFQRIMWGSAFAAGVAAVWALTRFMTLDYGFWGCMMPVGASLFRQVKKGKLKKWDRNLVHVLSMAVFMIPVALEIGQWQWWSMLALPLLKLYSGSRGKYKMKYFFYIFYPAHLLAIQGLKMLLQMG